MGFEKLIRNLNELSDEKFIEGLFVQAARDYEPELIDLNTSQLEVGLLSSGKNTPEYTNADYARLKSSMGSKSGGNYDYKFEGDFYGGFDLEFKGSTITFDSKDSKTDILTSPPYGQEDVFGLTEASQEEAVELIMPDFVDEFEKIFLNGL